MYHHQILQYKAARQLLLLGQMLSAYLATEIKLEFTKSYHFSDHIPHRIRRLPHHLRRGVSVGA